MKNNCPHFVVSLSAAVFICINASSAAAQNIYKSQTGAQFTWYGHGAAIVGDVNADGFDDYAAGADYDDTTGANAGKVFVYSGKSGALLYSIFGASADDRFGSQIVGAGDINNDGRADFWVGAAYDDNGSFINCGSVSLISGVNGSVIYTVYGTKTANVLGLALAASPDLNGDGKADFIAGGYAYNNTDGMARVYSGANGAVLATFIGAAGLNENLGNAVAGPGDVDGDGIPDIVVGSPGHDNLPTINIGKVTVYSGATFLPIYTVVGTGSNEGLGSFLSKAGDINNDGKADYLCGSPQDSTGSPSAGKFQVRSGANGSVIYQYVGSQSQAYLGYAPAGGADFNGDGIVDYGCGNRINSITGGYRFYSGADGSVISTKSGSAGQVNYGIYSANCDGDVNGDGLADVLVTSAPHYADSSIGYLDIWTFVPNFVTLYGTGTPGCDGAHFFSTSRTPHVGDPAWPIVCTRMPSNSLGACFITDVADFAGSDTYGLDFLLHVDLVNSTQIINVDVPTDVFGMGEMALPIPNDPNLIHQTFFLQMIDYWDPNVCIPSTSGFTSSNGMQVILQS